MCDCLFYFVEEIHVCQYLSRMVLTNTVSTELILYLYLTVFRCINDYLSFSTLFAWLSRVRSIGAVKYEIVIGN